MKKLAYAFAFVALLASAGYLWLSGRDDRPTSQITAQSNDQVVPSLLAAGSHASAAGASLQCADGMCGSASQGGTATSAVRNQRLLPFLTSTGNLRSIAHEALKSNDPLILQYAKMYAARCEYFGTGPKSRPWISAPNFAELNPALAQSLQKQLDFCGDLAGRSDGQMNYALSSKLESLGLPGSDKEVKVDDVERRLKANMEARAGDLLMQQLGMLRSPEKISEWLVSQGIASKDLRFGGDSSISGMKSANFVMVSSYENFVLPRCDLCELGLR